MTKNPAENPWDDPPRKVVGRRTPPKGGLVELAGFLRMAGLLQKGEIGWPKGVFRFKTHEEADLWWTKNMIRK